jgi:hypothetical protein
MIDDLRGMAGGRHATERERGVGGGEGGRFEQRRRATEQSNNPRAAGCSQRLQKAAPLSSWPPSTPTPLLRHHSPSPMMRPRWSPRPWPPVLLRFMMELGWGCLGAA